LVDWWIGCLGAVVAVFFVFSKKLVFAFFRVFRSLLFLLKKFVFIRGSLFFALPTKNIDLALVWAIMVIVIVVNPRQ